MPIELNCPNCGARLRVPDDSAGKRATCPSCSDLVSVPDAETAGETRDSQTQEQSPFGEGNVNPYASPSATDDFPAAGPAYGALTPGIRLAMAQTRPWVLFVAIVGFLGSGLMALGTVGLLFVSFRGGAFASLLLAFAYALMTAVAIALSVFLLRYAQRIGDFLNGNQVHHLEAALFAQRAYWMLFGIAMAVLMGLYVLLMGLMAVGMFAMGPWS